MQLICVGDVANAAGDDRQNAAWPFPNKQAKDIDTRILLNWELPYGDAANPVP